MDNEPHRILELALRLAREAGAIQRARYESGVAAATKSASIDLVTEVDHACETHIVAEIARERPSDAIVAEEGHGRAAVDATWCWVIDPLDGTTNFAHGYPWFCVSIGVLRKGVRFVGVVYEALRDELFFATKGGGARRNDATIRVSSCDALGRALLATGFAYDIHESDDDNLAAFARVAKRARGLRRAGSAALDLCSVACGRLDGYWEAKLKVWDVAAGLLIVEEAGGRVSDFSRGASPDSGREVLATNGVIHASLQTLIREAR